MDRVTKLRGQAGGSNDSTVSDFASNESYTTANESSKYFSLSEEDSTFDISPIKDVSLASAASVEPEKNPENNGLIADLTPTSNKNEMLEYKIGKQIEAANILSGGVDIFEDNNSYDGNELVIDDNADIQDKPNSDLKLPDNSTLGLGFQKAEDPDATLVDNEAVGSKDTEVLLQIDGKNVNAIDIGNGLYLYRKDGQDELAAVQIIDDDQSPPSFKFLKVRENAEGNLEVYEEIEVPKEVPPNEGKTAVKKPSQGPVKEAKKTISDSTSHQAIEVKNDVLEIKKLEVAAPTKEKVIEANKEIQNEIKVELNLNGETLKLNDKRKSPVIHSTPNKEGIPLTKTMVDLHLHPNRHLDNVKTIEVHTDIKHKQSESPTKNIHVEEEIFLPAVVTNKADIDLKKSDTELDKKTESQREEKPLIESKSPKNKIVEKSDEKALVHTTEMSKETLNIGENVIPTIELKKIVQKSIENDTSGTSKDVMVKENLTNDAHVTADETVAESVDDIINKNEKNNMIITSQNQNELKPNKVDLKLSDSGDHDNVIQSEDQTEKQKLEAKITDFFNKYNNPKINKNDENKNAVLTLNSTENRVTENKSDIKEQSSALIPNNNEQNSGFDTLKNSIYKDESSKEKVSIECISNETTKSLTESDANEATSEVKEATNKPLANDKYKDFTADNNTYLHVFQETKINEIVKSNEQKETVKLDTSLQTNITNPLTDPIKSFPANPNESIEIFPKVSTETSKDTVKPNNFNIENPIVNVNKVEKLLSCKADVINFVKEKQMDIPLLNQIPIVNQSSVVNQVNLNNRSIKPEASTKVETQEKNNLGTYELNKHNFAVAKHSTLPAQVQHVTETKKDIAKVTSKVDHKPINNNHAAVPFGKWTEANRQEFLNKIKESKIPINIANANQIKQPNDLNRRDVLQKIDSQRQTNNAIALAKNQESKNMQSNVKIEAKSFVNKSIPVSKESKLPLKTEQGAIKTTAITTNKIETKQDPSFNHPVLKDMPNTVFSSSDVVAKKESSSRKEINNQDLIDKTIEGIINKVILAKPAEDKKQDVSKSHTKTQLEKVTYPVTQQSKESKPSILDAIEIKMNELHGIPFVERPPHELPHRFTHDLKTYSAHDKAKSVVNKKSNIATALTIHKNKEKTANELMLDLDSEEEIIEFEPVTGDVALNNLRTEGKHSPAQPTPQAATQVSTTDKNPIITENEFDKFARRTSITLENCLSLNNLYQLKNPPEPVVDKGVPVKKYSRNEQLLAEAKVKSTNKHQQILRQSQQCSKIQMSSKLMPVTDEALNKNYQSKLQLAYQSALTAKRQKESPITIIEDKPVKVVFMDANHEYTPRKLNVQGNQLSPPKKSLPEPETNDSLDSDIFDIANEAKLHDDSKCKIKHQRKQVLTPVETPELELIDSKDFILNDEGSPKKKRKLEDSNSKSEKSSKHLLPKKTYLLNRSTAPEESLSSQPSTSQSPSKETTSPQATASTSHCDAASAIDNLVKAAELLENQSETLGASTPSTISATSQDTPIKRGRGRPRKYPLPEGTPDKVKTPSPQKKPRFNTKKPTTKDSSDSDSDSDYASSSEEGIARENWTMGKINENIVCPICNKLFRSENVVFKHVKHCSGPSPNRLSSGRRERRKSRRSGEERKSRGSKSDDANNGEKRISEKDRIPKKSKSNESSTSATTPPEGNKDEVVVVENSPVLEKPAQDTPRRPGRPRIYPKDAIFECEFCGKQFKQMSYLVNHKLQHKKNETKNEIKKTDEKHTIFSCEVCKKEFRKLHHLVQHRLIHNSNDGPSKPARKTSSEQSSNNIKEQEVAKQDDQNAAFRCEPCDKSFRKLHHLVEHRETHDGINRQKTPAAALTDDKPASSDPPQCDVCNKTFRKLHHLVEHKEQHNDANSDKSDDKSVKSSLSTKDIIHECSLCYMVFPNEHSLNKHTVNCLKKKKQAAEKQKVTEDQSNKEETSANLYSNVVEEPQIKTILIDEEEEEPKAEPKRVEDKADDTLDSGNNIKISEILQKRLLNESESKPVETGETKPLPTKRESISTDTKEPQIPAKVPKLDENTKDKIPTEDSDKVKPLPKEKVAPAVTKRRKSSTGSLSIVKNKPIVVESSDDDEARYMLNPEYKAEDECESAFMEVRANKRNSLHIERSNSKCFVKRRTSLQHAPKVPRLKPKPIEVRVPSSNTGKPKLDSVSSIDSDDSDVKYSFPNTVENIQMESQDVKPIDHSKKSKKKSVEAKRKSLTGIAKRKSRLGKAAASAKDKSTSAIKRRTLAVEHRCDCGELFSSAAMLARHTTLAHTPPRRRPHRSPLPQPKPRKSTPKVTEKPPDASRKSSTNDKPKPAAKSRKSSTNDKLKTVAASRIPSTNDKPKPATGARKSSTNEHKAAADSRKSSSTSKIKAPVPRKSSVNDKPKAAPRKTSVNKTKSVNSRKSTINDKPKAVDSRKSSANDKPKAADSRKSSINDKPKAADSRKSTVNDKPKVADSRKSSVNDKPKAADSRKSSVNDKPKAADSRKSSINDKLKAADSRNTISNTKTPDKSQAHSENNTPKRKSVRVSSSGTLKRTIPKTRWDVAHRGVPVPEKLKKMMEKNNK